MTEADLREVPTVEALVEHVRAGVFEIVRAALEEAAQIHEEADAAVARYDGITSELAALKVERHSLTHDLQEIPERIHKARLDGLVDDGVGEDADLLERRYIAARERRPVVEARIARLADELSSLVSGGSRPAKVRNERTLLKHNSRQPAQDALNEADATLRDLHAALELVVPKDGEELRRTRDATRDSQNVLWGQAKAQR